MAGSLTVRAIVLKFPTYPKIRNCLVLKSAAIPSKKNIISFGSSLARLTWQLAVLYQMCQNTPIRNGYWCQFLPALKPISPSAMKTLWMCFMVFYTKTCRVGLIRYS